MVEPPPEATRLRAFLRSPRLVAFLLAALTVVGLLGGENLGKRLVHVADPQG